MGGWNMDADFTRSIYRLVMPELPNESSLGEDGQFEWVWAVPLPYRVLADSRRSGAMPESPRNLLSPNGYGYMNGNHAHGRGYFASLQSFLTYSFAWTRHDRGLRRWHEQGQATDDARLALVKAVWGADEMLLRYAAWCTDGTSDTGGETWFGEPLHAFMSRPVDFSPQPRDDAWSEIVRAERDRAHADDLSASPWGMHLGSGDHIAAPSGLAAAQADSADGRAAVSHARIVGADTKRRRATYISDHVHGWYAGLAALGSELPPLSGGANWRIDVFVKPYGFLGTYRRSTMTGLWFSGRHRHHEMGN